MAAPKSQLNIGGSEAYLERRRKKRERLYSQNKIKATYDMHTEDEGDDPGLITGTKQEIANEKARRKGKKKPYLGRSMKTYREAVRARREKQYFGDNKKKAKDQAKGLSE